MFPVFMHDFNCIIVTVYLLATLYRLPFPFRFFRKITVRKFVDTIYNDIVNATVIKR